MTHDIKNTDTVAIGTKVPAWLADRFKTICKMHGQSMYDVLQKLLELFLLMADTGGEVPDELQQLIHKFQHIAGWKEQFTYNDRPEKMKVIEATYYLQCQDRDGNRALHISEPFFGEWESTFNNSTILEHCLSLILPDMYKLLRRIAAEEECRSADETIDLLARMYIREHHLVTKGIDEMFADNRRSDFGLEFGDIPHVLNPQRGMDNKADRQRLDDTRQTKIDFDDDGTQ